MKFALPNTSPIASRLASRAASLAIAAALALAGASTAMAQAYPNKPTKIIVAYQAGQGTDVATRYIAEQLGKAMGQTFFVENRGGAGGNIGTADAARAAPDGYTLTMGTNGTHALNQYLYAATGFDAEKDFEPIVLISTFPMVVLAGAGTPYQSMADVFAAARNNPKSADIALPSTTARLVFELLKERSQVPLFGVPYKGSAAAATDVIGGQVPLSIDTISAARGFLASGKLRALGVTSANPTALLPGVKTVAEQGLAGFEVVAWNALYAPRGTPPAVIKRLNEEVTKILAQPETRQRLLQLGHEPAGGTPEQLAEFARAERAKWGPLITKVGLKAE